MSSPLGLLFTLVSTLVPVMHLFFAEALNMDVSLYVGISSPWRAESTVKKTTQLKKQVLRPYIMTLFEFIKRTDQRQLSRTSRDVQVALREKSKTARNRITHAFLVSPLQNKNQSPPKMAPKSTIFFQPFASMPYCPLITPAFTRVIPSLQGPSPSDFETRQKRA